MPLTIDTVIGGRYRLGPLLGRGGMAEVYDAVDSRLDRPVAVKVLRPEMAARIDVRRRFEAEARGAARLSHSNVVAIFDTGEDDGLPWIVMERLPGETLADRMGKDPLDTAWVGRVAGDVLGALGAAHAAGLIHRDVKPGNILIGADGCAKVADFGIAKSLEAVGDETHTGQLVGTPAYLAPERIDGEPATVRSDLFALGVVLYEALAGEKPFRGTTPVSIAYAVRHTDPKPLAEVRPDLPAHLVGAVERAMARDPEQRFASAADMARALAVGLGGHDDITVLSVTSVDERDDDATLHGADPATRVQEPVPVHALVPGPPVDERGGGFMPPAPRRTSSGVVVAFALLLITLLAAGLLAARDETTASAELHDQIRDAAGELGPSDGARAGDSATRLRAIADRLQRGDGAGAAAEANALLTELATWQATGQLASGPVARVKALVLQVPGADGGAFAVATTAPPPPTTVAPAEQRDGDRKRGKGKGDDDDDDDDDD
ncbi:MAG TPA: serine/threonine-protein kinase [Acidimicrobiales bacterium]